MQSYYNSIGLHGRTVTLSLSAAWRPPAGHRELHGCDGERLLILSL